jgi:hypothetical protein
MDNSESSSGLRADSSGVAGHTAEPWRVAPNEGSYVATEFSPRNVMGGSADGNSDYILSCVIGDVPQLDAEANARRIVACVNACVGIPTENLENGCLTIEVFDQMTKERGDLLAALQALRAVEFGHSEKDICAIRQQADAAIARAQGE